MVVQELSSVHSKIYLVGRSVYISTGQLGFYRYVFVYFLSIVVLLKLFLIDSHPVMVNVANSVFFRHNCLVGGLYYNVLELLG